MLLKQAVKMRQHALRTGRPADHVVRRFTGKADDIAQAFHELLGRQISHALYRLMFEGPSGKLTTEDVTEVLEKDYEFVGDGSVTIEDLANILVALGCEWRGWRDEEETFAVQMRRVARVL